ncbi:MAG: hypothetical protein O2901_09740 [Verrucomicrobia bacterium]|nr:hypothetical protein [Verrucomicrobiota bacterium]
MKLQLQPHSVRRCLKDDSAQAMVEASIGLSLMAFVFIMIAIIGYMMQHRTRTVMAARHAAWIGANLDGEYDSGGVLATVRAAVKEGFFYETGLVRVEPGVFGEETLISVGEFMDSPTVGGGFYRVEYGLDPADPGSYIDPADVPFPLNLYEMKLPFVADDEKIYEGEFATDTHLGIVNGQCKWNATADTWTCLGDLGDGLVNALTDELLTLTF